VQSCGRDRILITNMVGLPHQRATVTTHFTGKDQFMLQEILKHFT